MMDSVLLTEMVGRSDAQRLFTCSTFNNKKLHPTKFNCIAWSERMPLSTVTSYQILSD
jgi:hypothetical protein